MDIEGLSMALAQNKVMTDISTQVLAMSIDRLEEAGAGVVELLDKSVAEHSVMPNLGGHMDITI